MQVNGVNLQRIPARDAYSYGLALLDALFSRDELGQSLVFRSKKSSKPGLDPLRVEKLFGEFSKHFNTYIFQACTCHGNPAYTQTW